MNNISLKLLRLINKKGNIVNICPDSENKYNSIINAFKELISLGYLTFDNDGIIILTDKGLEYLRESKLKKDFIITEREEQKIPQLSENEIYLPKI